MKEITDKRSNGSLMRSPRISQQDSFLQTKNQITIEEIKEINKAIENNIE